MVQLYEKNIKEDPSEISKYKGLGRALNKYGETRGMIIAYQEAMSKNYNGPGHTTTSVKLCWHVREGDIHAYERAVKEESTWTWACETLAAAWTSKSGRESKIIEMYEKQLKRIEGGSGHQRDWKS